MTAGETGRSVSRAFRIIGLAFLIGGPYMGAINYLFYTPEAVELEAVVEDIGSDATRAQIRYEYDGAVYRGEVGTTGELPDWQKGDRITAYILASAPEDPRLTFPQEPASETRDTLMITFGPFVMGVILLVSNFFEHRSGRRRYRELVSSMNKAKTVFRRPAAGSPGVPLHTARFRGSWLIGGIMLTLGVALSSAMAVVIAGAGSWDSPESLMMFFPLLLGFGIVSIGWPELYTYQVAVMPDLISIARRTPVGIRRQEIPLRSVYGLTERFTAVKYRESEARRHIFREYAPLTDDYAQSDTAILRVPDDKQSWKKVREFSSRTGLPLIFTQEDHIKVIDPEGEEHNLAESDKYEEVSGDFNSRYIRLIRNDETGLVVSRGSKRGIIWGAVIIALGITGTLLAGALSILIPTLVMASFFIVMGAKTDRLSAENGAVRFEDQIFGKDLGGITIPYAQVERISIDSDPRRHMATSLIINSADERITFGQGSSGEELDWIAGRLRKLIAGD